MTQLLLGPSYFLQGAQNVKFLSRHSWRKNNCNLKINLMCYKSPEIGHLSYNSSQIDFFVCNKVLQIIFDTLVTNDSCQ